MLVPLTGGIPGGSLLRGRYIFLRAPLHAVPGLPAVLPGFLWHGERGAVVELERSLVAGIDGNDGPLPHEGRDIVRRFRQDQVGQQAQDGHAQTQGGHTDRAYWCLLLSRMRTACLRRDAVCTPFPWWAMHVRSAHCASALTPSEKSKSYASACGGSPRERERTDIS